jgi:hypothetical protein
MSVRLDGSYSWNCPDRNQCRAGSISDSHRDNKGIPAPSSQSVLLDDMSPRSKAALTLGFPFLINSMSLNVITFACHVLDQPRRA